MNAIVPLDQDQSVQSVKLLVGILTQLKADVFEEGVDYGVIPGTNTKPVLLLAGMEKLLRALRLRPEYVLRQSIVDFDKPLFYFQYECRLIEIDTNLVVATAIGSANSMESKWRYRNAERVCPNCGAATIKRSKFPPKNAPHGTPPGWYCYDKLGGCGANFAYEDNQIIEQEVGRTENPDLADQLNTIDKISQKRALSSSVKIVANASMLFDIDLEDMVSQSMTDAEVRRLAADFPDLIADDFRAALGGPSSQWKGGYPAAWNRIADWKRKNRPTPAPLTVTVEISSEQPPASTPAAGHDDVIEGTFSEEPKRVPLTRDEIDALLSKWSKSNALTSADLKKALGGSYDKWMHGQPAADKRIAEWLAEQFDGAPAS